jgi:hypothetical protein
MGDVVNLRKVRKAAQRREQQDRAPENRIVHGRSKAERVLENARRKQLEQIVDQHLLKPDPTP